jgi:hypothetical protein
MKCHVCNRGVPEGVTLFRQNEFGVTGIWACREHNRQVIRPDVDDLVKIIESGK